MHNLSQILQKKLTEEFYLIPEKEIYLEQDSQIEYDFLSNTYTLLLVISGKISLTTDQLDQKEFNEELVSIELTKETGLLLPPNCPCFIMALDHSQICRITFSGSLSNIILSETLQQGNFVDSTTFFQIIRDSKRLKTLSFEQSEYAPLSLSLLLHLYKNTKALAAPLYPPVVTAAIKLMEENFTYLYGIEELAEQLEVSKNHFIRQFHDTIGISPGRYLTNVKINHAKELLQNGETSLELIAISCGFSGAPYFRKVFKKETGLSPTEFRKKDKFITKSELPNEFYL